MSSPFIKSSLSVLVAFSLVACTPSKTSEEYLTDADILMENGDTSAAVIELKNAVKSGFDNFQIRQLLGSIYLKQGFAASAEKEFIKALELGGDENIIIPNLLKSLNIQDKYEEILTTIDSLDHINDDILPIVKLYSALAYQQTGRFEEAKSAVSEANDFSADSVYSRLGKAYLQESNSKNGETLNVLADIINDNPAIIETYMLQGQLYFIEGEYNKSVESFKKYQQLAPNDIKIKLFLANSYLNNKQFSEADKELDYLLKVSPQHAFSNQLKGVIHYQQGDYASALSFTEKAIQNGINSLPNRIVAGLSAFKQNKYEIAFQYLGGIHKQLPKNHPVIRVLAMVQIELGYHDEAVDVLGDLEAISTEDANLFTTASFELLKSGNLKGAKSLLSKVGDIETDSANDITRIGILKLSLNDLEGIADLERAVNIDANLPIAKIALISAYTDNGEFDKAISLAVQWKEDAPNKAAGFNLLAKIYLLQNEIEKAEFEMTSALSIAPENPYSLLYFANKSLINNQFNKAEANLDTLFMKYPNNIKGLSLLYKVQVEIGNTNNAVASIERAFNDNSTNIQYRILQAKTLLREKQYKQVIELLSSVVKDKNTQFIIWALIGKSYEESTQFEEAISTYNQWILYRPDSRYAYQKKVAVQEQMKDYSGALNTVNKVLRKLPDDVEFMVMLAYFQQKSGLIDSSQQTLNKLPENIGNMSVVQSIQGQIFFNQKLYKKALPKLNAIYNEQPTAYNMSYVYTSLNELNTKEQALRFLKTHVSDNKGDVFSKTLLAEKSMGVDNSLAQVLFDELLVIKPNDGALLNNAAWVESELGNLNKAEMHILNALEVLKNNGQVLDTLGLIKLKQNKKQDAISAFEKALSFAPENTAIKQHLKEANQLNY
ncbi:MAG: putative PEP-CTERM system TPR-repeat lipoprotein [Alteromonadaceae bacterium]|jgi:putative PEP-CTERM system TPR-repeat lipoprotein